METEGEVEEESGTVGQRSQKLPLGKTVLEPYISNEATRISTLTAHPIQKSDFGVV